MPESEDVATHVAATGRIEAGRGDPAAACPVCCRLRDASPLAPFAEKSLHDVARRIGADLVEEQRRRVLIWHVAVCVDYCVKCR